LAGGQGGDVTERNQAGFWTVGAELPANRALMRRAAAGKLSLDLDKKGVYASYTPGDAVRNWSGILEKIVL